MGYPLQSSADTDYRGWGAQPHPSRLIYNQVHPLISLYWRRALINLHRAHVAMCSKGLKGAFSRATTLSLLPAPEHTVAGVTAGKGEPRILFIDATTPRPDHDSGSLRLHSLMSGLVTAGYAVDFLPDDSHDAGVYSRFLLEAGIGMPCKPRSSPPRWLLSNYRRYDVIVICRYHLAYVWMPLLRKLPQRPRIVLDTVDLHHVREMREARLLGNHSLARAAKRTRKLELQAIRAADTTWVVSAIEQQALLQEIPGLQIEVVSNLHHPISHAAPYRERSGLLFIGSGRHPPNRDAVDWFVREILPYVRSHIPECQLHVVGEGLMENADGVVVHGQVADLTPLLTQCRLGLAPLRFGAGVKGKVNQYMAHGLPVIATSCATEGMHLKQGIDVMEADTASEFAATIVRAYSDIALWQRLSTGGLSNIKQHFTFDAALPALERTFGRALPHG